MIIRRICRQLLIIRIGGDVFHIEPKETYKNGRRVVSSTRPGWNYVKNILKQLRASKNERK